MVQGLVLICMPAYNASTDATGEIVQEFLNPNYPLGLLRRDGCMSNPGGEKYLPFVNESKKVL